LQLFLDLAEQPRVEPLVVCFNTDNYIFSTFCIHRTIEKQVLERHFRDFELQGQPTSRQRSIVPNHSMPRIAISPTDQQCFAKATSVIEPPPGRTHMQTKVSRQREWQLMEATIIVCVVFDRRPEAGGI
jgi:hypothetical protein